MPRKPSPAILKASQIHISLVVVVVLVWIHWTVSGRIHIPVSLLKVVFGILAFMASLVLKYLRLPLFCGTMLGRLPIETKIPFSCLNSCYTTSLVASRAINFPLGSGRARKLWTETDNHSIPCLLGVCEIFRKLLASLILTIFPGFVHSPPNPGQQNGAIHLRVIRFQHNYRRRT